MTIDEFVNTTTKKEEIFTREQLRAILHQFINHMIDEAEDFNNPDEIIYNIRELSGVIIGI